MGDLVRFGVSAEEELMVNFDRLSANKGYSNRSEALRDLMRDALVQARLEEFPDVFPGKIEHASIAPIEETHRRVNEPLLLQRVPVACGELEPEVRGEESPFLTMEGVKGKAGHGELGNWVLSNG